MFRPLTVYVGVREGAGRRPTFSGGAEAVNAQPLNTSPEHTRRIDQKSKGGQLLPALALQFVRCRASVI